MTLVKCKPGTIANQQQSCPDTDAVGIQSITQSADGKKLYITLTDGTTQTFTLPVGIGPIGPTGATGAAGADGVSVLHNDLSVSTNTTTALEVLKTHTIPANKLDADRDEITIATCLELINANTTAITISFGGINIVAGVPPDVLSDAGSSIVLLYLIKISRKGANAGIYQLTRLLTDGINVAQQWQSLPLPIVADFTISNIINVEVLANVAPTGVACRQLEVIYYQS